MAKSPSKRVNESLVSIHERRILLSVARRLPRWITPDGLTWLGVAGAATVTLGGALSHEHGHGWLWLANLGLVLHWLGDSLDGTLARYRQIERPRYGFYLDQVIDTVGNLLIALGEGLAPGMRLELTLLLLAAYQMLAIQVLVRANIGNAFQVAVGGLGPTELRLAIFMINLGIIVFGTRTVPGLPAWIGWQDIVVGTGITGLLILFGTQMYSHLAVLAQEDPRRQ